MYLLCLLSVASNVVCDENVLDVVHIHVDPLKSNDVAREILKFAFVDNIVEAYFNG